MRKIINFALVQLKGTIGDNTRCCLTCWLWLAQLVHCRAQRGIKVIDQRLKLIWMQTQKHDAAKTAWRARETHVARFNRVGRWDFLVGTANTGQVSSTTKWLNPDRGTMSQKHIQSDCDAGTIARRKPNKWPTERIMVWSHMRLGLCKWREVTILHNTDTAANTRW